MSREVIFNEPGAGWRTWKANAGDGANPKSDQNPDPACILPVLVDVNKALVLTIVEQQPQQLYCLGLVGLLSHYPGTSVSWTLRQSLQIPGSSDSLLLWKQNGSAATEEIRVEEK